MPTTTTRMVAGPCLAKIQLDPTKGTPDALVELGYSEDGFSISERPLTNDVHSDRNGGTSGEPIDVQYMGTIATIRMKLIDFDYTQVKRLKQWASKTALADGQVPEPGCLLLADAEYFRMLLEGAKDTAAIAGGGAATDYQTPMNFERCLLKDTVDYNLGSRVTAIELVVTAYTFVDSVDSKRKLYNRITTT